MKVYRYHVPRSQRTSSLPCYILTPPSVLLPSMTRLLRTQTTPSRPHFPVMLGPSPAADPRCLGCNMVRVPHYPPLPSSLPSTSPQYELYSWFSTLIPPLEHLFYPPGRPSSSRPLNTGMSCPRPPALKLCSVPRQPCLLYVHGNLQLLCVWFTQNRIPPKMPIFSLTKN